MIYIIEDNLWQAEQFGRLLIDNGYEISSFSNGIDAVASIDIDKPDVIILDMLLGGTTGITLLHELQSYTDTGAIPVVVCTALADEMTLDQLTPYGVKRIIDKTTMQPDDIVAAVRSVT